MAVPVTFHCLTEDIAEKVHNFGTDTLKVMLTNTAPDATNDTVPSDITEISAGNGYTAGGFDTQNATSRTGRVTSVTAVDVTLTASGSVGPYRYVVLYNDTATKLIAYIDKGSSLTLSAGQSDTFDFGSSLFTLTATT